MQFVANGEIRFDPPELSAIAVIDVHGCAGRAGDRAGGGAGAGGAILLEAPLVYVGVHTVLFARGGGGAGGGLGATDGDEFSARGGFPGSDGGGGGEGGTREFNGRTIAGSGGGGGALHGGGGGGAVGRIRINAIVPSIVPGTTFPDLDDAVTTTTLGAPRVQ